MGKAWLFSCVIGCLGAFHAPACRGVPSSALGASRLRHAEYAERSTLSMLCRVRIDAELLPEASSVGVVVADAAVYDLVAHGPGVTEIMLGGCRAAARFPCAQAMAERCLVDLINAGKHVQGAGGSAGWEGQSSPK